MHAQTSHVMHSLWGGVVGGVGGGVQSLARPGDCCSAGGGPGMYVAVPSRVSPITSDESSSATTGSSHSSPSSAHVLHINTN